MIYMRKGVNSCERDIYRDPNLMTVTGMDLHVMTAVYKIMNKAEIPYESYLLVHKDGENYDYKMGNSKLLYREDCETHDSVTLCDDYRYQFFIEPQYYENFKKTMKEVFHQHE